MLCKEKNVCNQRVDRLPADSILCVRHVRHVRHSANHNSPFPDARSMSVATDDHGYAS